MMSRGARRWAGVASRSQTSPRRIARPRVPSLDLTVGGGCTDPAQAVPRHPLLRRVRWYDHPIRPSSPATWDFLGGAP